MAYATGTATGPADLWTKLLAFLTTDAALVAAGQNWSSVWTAPVGAPNLTDVMLKGPGLSGTDSVYVGLRRTDNTLTLNESLIWLSGATGFSPSATQFTGHVNSLGNTPAMFLDNASMQYWFVANGRRFVVVTKMSTVYNAMYAGLYHPYAIPSEYPYPLFIGGSRGFTHVGGSFPQPTTWRASESLMYSAFPAAHGNYFSASSYADTQALFLTPDGTWTGLTSNPSSSYAAGIMPTAYLAPRAVPPRLGIVTIGDTNVSLPEVGASQSGPNFGTKTVLNRTIPGLDSEYPLTNITVMAWTPNSSLNAVTYGALDGVYGASIVGTSAETIVTVGGVDHLVVQNIQRTASTEYWALALE